MTLVIRNIVHSIVTGVFATYFFTAFPKSGSPKKFILNIQNPTVKSIYCTIRALDTICFKSLIMIPFRNFFYTGPDQWYEYFRYTDVSIVIVSF